LEDLSFAAITLEHLKYDDFAKFLRLLYVGSVQVKSGPPHTELLKLCQKYSLKYKSRKVYQSDNYLVTIPYISLERFCNDKNYSDISFRLGNKVFSAHKAILSARSSYFYKLFENGSSDEQVVLDQCAPEQLNIILQYIYHGLEARKFLNDLASWQIMNMLQLAATYRILDLKEQCESLLASSMDDGELFLMYKLASETQSAQLKRFCLSRMAPFFDKIKQSNQLSILPQDLLEQLHQDMHQILNRSYIGCSVKGKYPEQKEFQLQPQQSQESLAKTSGKLLQSAKTFETCSDKEEEDDPNCNSEVSEYKLSQSDEEVDAMDLGPDPPH